MEHDGKRKLRRTEKILVKNASVIMAALIFLMFINVVVSFFFIRRHLISDYNAVVGRMFKEDEEISGKLADYLMADDFTDGDIRDGKLALQKFGYTAEGMSLAKTFDTVIYVICVVVFLSLFALLLPILILQRRYLLLAAEEEKERVREEVMRSNQGERRFLEKKAGQSQNYLENVAHQVRTPLTNIMLNIGLVYEEQTEEGKEILDECNYHAERINRLIERLLKIGRLEAGKVAFEKQKENIKELAERLVLSFRREARIVTELEDTFLYVDYDWLYEALKCLIDNCLEHIGEENHVFFTVKKESRNVIIQIEDDGSGFNKEDIPFLFERFYTSRDIHASKHYGIGLNLAKLIVEGHYGTISAYNRADGGAGFLINLPQYRLK